MTRYGTFAYLLPLAATLLAPPADAQRSDRSRTVSPICIGDCRRVLGLRLNFRDRNLERVDGINATIWTPYEPMGGVVNGIALGLPATVAGDINGLALGILGVGAAGRMRGIGLSPVGIGAGGELAGIMIGGVGAGTGGRMTGLIVGGIGAGSGGGFTGIAIGGIGVGSGGNVRGLSIGGIGVGGGGNMRGIQLGGIGVGQAATSKGCPSEVLVRGVGGTSAELHSPASESAAEAGSLG